MQLAVKRYSTPPRTATSSRTIAPSPTSSARCPGRSSEIFSCAAHRATGELDELAAGAGIGLFALVWAGKGSLIARNLRGGTGQLPAAIGRELGERARVNSRVDAVRPDGSDLIVITGGEEIRARHVIMAAQAPYAAPLVAPVAPSAADALAQLTYGAFLSVAVETNETTAMPYDGVYAIATPGRVFDMFTNQAHALRVGPRQPGGSLMLFAGAQAAAALMRESRRGDRRALPRRPARDVPADPRRRSPRDGPPLGAGQRLRAAPAAAALQAPLEGALGAHENLHLAGDYFAELGTMEAAAQTGLAAAERVESRIREVSHV